MTPVSLDALKDLAHEIFPAALEGKPGYESLDLKSELGLDSFSMLQFFSAIEDKFDIDLFSRPAEPDARITLHTLLDVCKATQIST